MGDACIDCRKWEEQIYWTHFQTMHFYQFLTGDDFDQQLTIPKKFANNVKDKLSETVTLKGPSGATWNVGLVTSGAALIFRDGWKEFANDHSLEENDLLVFKYHGNSHFDVLIFDQQSLCERESSYFVRKCGHTMLDGDCQSKRKVGDSSAALTPTSSHEAVECTSMKKPRNEKPVTPEAPQRQANPRATQKVHRGAHSIATVGAMQRLKNREPSSSSVGAKVISAGAKQDLIKMNSGYPEFYLSSRRLVTAEEKERALQMAHAASTDESFMVVMRPTHVYKRFYMSVPTVWAHSRLSSHNQDVFLYFNDRKWLAKYHPDKSRGSGGLTCGWKNFSLDNNLEEFDVCVFELASAKDNAIAMDVSIFRVVEEIRPLTRVLGARAMKRR